SRSHGRRREGRGDACPVFSRVEMQECWKSLANVVPRRRSKFRSADASGQSLQAILSTLPSTVLSPLLLSGKVAARPRLLTRWTPKQGLVLKPLGRTMHVLARPAEWSKDVRRF